MLTQYKLIEVAFKYLFIDTVDKDRCSFICLCQAWRGKLNDLHKKQSSDKLTCLKKVSARTFRFQIGLMLYSLAKESF
jgi:hypothetical protein